MPFIVAAPRSGTTLLRFMLDAHSELAIPQETGFLIPCSQLTSDGETLKRTREPFRLLALPARRRAILPESARSIYSAPEASRHRRHGAASWMTLGNLPLAARHLPSRIPATN